jgi:hypothetical protein
LGNGLEGLDHQVEFVGAVGLPRNAIVLAGVRVWDLVKS